MEGLKRFSIYFYLNELNEYLGADHYNITAYDEHSALIEFRKKFPYVKIIKIEEWW